MSSKRRVGVIVAVGLAAVVWALAPLMSDSAPGPAESEPSGFDVWRPAPAGDAASSSGGVEGGPASTTSPQVVSAEDGNETAPATVDVATVDTAIPADGHVEGEEEPAVQPLWSVVPADTPSGVVEELVAAVAARLVAEMTGEGREDYPDVVWLSAPCCARVEVTGLVADFSTSGVVRVVAEWETDRGRGSGPTYWRLDDSGGWVLAVAGVGE